MDAIKPFLEKKLTLTDEEWVYYATLLKRQEYPKKATILRTGETENHISFIEEGAVRFFIPKEENDLTFAFIFENDFVCAYDSFLTQQPCSYNAETLTKTIIWQLSYENLQKMYASMPNSNIFGRLFTEEIYLKKAKRELSFLTKSPEERYLDLFIERPNLLLTIPLKYIASYIGVTPQALSRIRKRIY